MQPLTLDRFASIVGGRLNGDDAGDRVVHGVAIHSERLGADSVFVALSGPRGHRYVARALRNGAVGAVVAQDQLAAIDASGLAPLVVVDDPLTALQELARWWREQLTGTVVAVVGSNGKTVTKDALAHFAGLAGPTHASPGSYNSQLGVALALLECPEDAGTVVIEAAATQPGEMSRLRRMVAPHAVVFTNLGSRHQQNFGSPQAHARELLSMAEDLRPDGWLLVGEVDPTLTELARDLPARLLVRNESPQLPHFSVPEFVAQGLFTKARFPDGQAADLVVSTPSREILADMELAISAAFVLGVPARSLLDAVVDYLPTSTRMEMSRLPSGASVVTDVVTSDPLALGAAVRTANGLRGPAGKTIAVFLANTLPGVDATTAAARLAPILISEGVGMVLGWDTPLHRALAARLDSADASAVVPVELASSVGQLPALVSAHLDGPDVALVLVSRDSTSDAWMQLVDSASPTRLYVDLAAIRSNVAAFRHLIGPHTKLMGVVKAHAYGTNPVHVGRCLYEAGADWLGVASTDEGVALRRAGLPMRILVFLPTPADLAKLVRHQLTPLIYSPDTLAAARSLAASLERPLEIHLEVDSGMHRTGFRPDAAIAALRRLREDAGGQLQLTGLMTHLGCPDDPTNDALTRDQLATFGKVSALAEELGFTGVLRHAAATAATIRFPAARLDMVRIGVGLYGVHPSAATTDLVSLTPAVGLVSQIIAVHELGRGDWVGYGGVYRVTDAHRRIGIIPAGYYDCVPRAFRAVGQVLVNGKACRIAGTISMDSMAIDITDHPDAGIGSEVLIFGRHAGSAIPIESAAAAMGTVSHELLTAVGPRVQRVFTQH